MQRMVPLKSVVLYSYGNALFQPKGGELQVVTTFLLLLPSRCLLRRVPSPQQMSALAPNTIHDHELRVRSMNERHVMSGGEGGPGKAAGWKRERSKAWKNRLRPGPIITRLSKSFTSPRGHMDRNFQRTRASIGTSTMRMLFDCCFVGRGAHPRWVSWARCYDFPLTTSWQPSVPKTAVLHSHIDQPHSKAIH